MITNRLAESAAHPEAETVVKDRGTGRAEINQDVVRRYFVCLDTEDWTTMRGLWHEGSALRAVGARPRDGIEEVIRYFSRLFSPWAHHVDSPTRIISADDTVVVEVKFKGVTLHGREVTFDAVDIFDLEGGRIRRLANWYDLEYARAVLRDPAVITAGASE
jgi:ketosteroid isomerase-like protein